jgi:L-ribulose-5-phosphate 3-epimerase UlaE
MPLYENEGASGDTLLEVSVDITDAALSRWEWSKKNLPGVANPSHYH